MLDKRKQVREFGRDQNRFQRSHLMQKANFGFEGFDCQGKHTIIPYDNPDCDCKLHVSSNDFGNFMDIKITTRG